MSYNIEVTDNFKKEAKHLLKKYPSLKNELSELFSSLEKSPEQGIAIGKNCYKIRVAISSKGKGKSGGARIITHIQIVLTKVYLLSIYDKSEQEDLSEKDLSNLLKQIP